MESQTQDQSKRTRRCSDQLTINSKVWHRAERPLPPGVIDADWDQVDAKLQSALVQAINSRKWPIYIFGEQGCGKTSAVAILYRAFRIRRGRPWWILLEEFVQQIMTCRTSRNRQCEIINPDTGESYFRSEVKWFELISQCPFLCVDDIGLRQPSEAGYEIVFKLINARIGKPTIYTSNHDENALAKVYGKRIKSRMNAGTVIHCTGGDRRDANCVRVEA